MNEQLAQQVRSTATLLNLPATWAETYITSNPEATIEQARAAAVTELGTQQQTIQHRAPATITRDADEGIVTRMADGLRARINPAHKVTDGREFAYFRVVDIARRCLELRGLSTLGSPVDLITRALHTTSDFAAVLQESYNKELLQFGAAQSPITQVFRRTTMSDFRARHVLEMSTGPGLDKVNEAGEIRYGSIADKELASYKIASHGKIFAISFQALVNDDIGALSDLTSKMGIGARRWFTGLLVDTILANPKLADNKAVFHADHGNLNPSPQGPGEDNLAAAKLAMRTQKDLSGEPINAQPKFILIPANLEAAVDRLLAELYPASPDDALVSARNLTPLVEPKLDAKGAGTAWYLFADPSVAPVFEYAELEGYQGPQIETRSGWNVLGVEVRVVWHVGAGAIDHRGAYKGA